MNKTEILVKVATGELSPADAVSLLQDDKPAGLTYKVSEKGALSVYGLQRFPVSLYINQWEKLLADVESLKTFAEENAARLTRK